MAEQMPQTIGVETNRNEEFMNDQNMLDIEEELKKLDGGSDVNVVQAVEKGLLNNRNQEISDVENSSTKSPSIASPECSRANESPPPVDPASIKSLANGSLPKSGKPMMLTLEKNTKKRVTKARGRPKQKALVAMYQSQIKDNNVGIKLCIKKSDLSSSNKNSKKTSSGSSTAAAPSAKSKTVRKRSRKSKQPQNSDSESEAYEKRRKKDGKAKSNNNTEKENEPKQAQSVFAERLPQHVLHRVSNFISEICEDL